MPAWPHHADHSLSAFGRRSTFEARMSAGLGQGLLLKRVMGVLPCLAALVIMLPQHTALLTNCITGGRYNSRACITAITHRAVIRRTFMTALSKKIHRIASDGGAQRTIFRSNAMKITGEPNLLTLRWLKFASVMRRVALPRSILPRNMGSIRAKSAALPWGFNASSEVK